MTRKKTQLLISVSTILLIVIILLIRNFMMPKSLSHIDEKYIMYTLVQDDSTAEDGIPKRVQYDASHLLKQPRYVRSGDSKLIDLEHEPIKELGWKLALRIQQNLPNKPKFSVFKNLSSIQFKEMIQDKVRWEYLYSGFSVGNTKKPDEDYFRIYFVLDNEEHRMLIMRKDSDISDDGYSYWRLDNFLDNNHSLTYQQYLAQLAEKSKAVTPSSGEQK